MKIVSRRDGRAIIQRLLDELDLAIKGTQDIRDPFFQNHGRIAEEVEDRLQDIRGILENAQNA